MKWFAWIITLINIYFGISNLLQALNILKTSKYSRTTDIVFAMLFLGMAIGSVYLLLAKDNHRMALLVSFGPWVLAFLFLLFNMLTSDYK